jgi:hypothetical protein
MWGPLGAMVDSGSDHTDRGVVPRVFQNLFSRIQTVRKFFTCSILFVNRCDLVDLMLPLSSLGAGARELS